MLHGLIEPGETLGCLIGGQFGPDLGQAKPGTSLHSGIIAATDRRILMVDKGLFGSTEVAEMPYESIEAITYSTGMMLAGMRITGRGVASFRLEMIDKRAVKPFVDFVRGHLQATHSATPLQTPVSSADEIAKLAGLMERGLLTREEFDAKKRQLLGL